MPRFRPAQIATITMFLLALLYLGWVGYGLAPKLLPTPTPTPRPAPRAEPRDEAFDAARALSLAQTQCDFGPRPTGSPAGRQTGDWIIEQLRAQGWEVATHEFLWNAAPVRNIIATSGPPQSPPQQTILVGAHYDTRLVADHDPDPARQSEPVLGGNDAASGVAVLLELAHVLDKEKLTKKVMLVFFDAEDNGNLPGWKQWAIGSTRLAEDMAADQSLPAAMILLDMIGDENQRLPFEGNSNPALRQQIWDLAAQLGYADVFLPEPGPTLIDDHIGFVQRGVPSVDIIDFDYPHWHTTADTCDKLSAASLGRVGHVLETYLEDQSLSGDKPLVRGQAARTRTSRNETH